MTIVRHVNKALRRISAEKVKAMFKYSDISQNVTLRMTPKAVFNRPLKSAMVTILGFNTSVITSIETSSSSSTREYRHPSVSGHVIRLTPSCTVSNQTSPSIRNNEEYTFEREAESVVDTHQGFTTICACMDVVESRAVVWHLC